MFDLLSDLYEAYANLSTIETAVVLAAAGAMVTLLANWAEKC